MTDQSTSTSGEFAGRVAIVTGSSSGIGEEIARRLAAGGARVVVNSATSVEAGTATAESLPPEAIYVPPDISDQVYCPALVDAAVGRFGLPANLYNNPGRTQVVPPHDPDAQPGGGVRRDLRAGVEGKKGS